MGKKEEFLKNIKSNKITLIVGILFLLSSLVSGIVVYSNKGKEMKDVKALAEVKKEEVYASVDVQVMTDYFATNDYAGIEHKTYFVWDKEYLYIVDLNDKTRESLNPIYDYSYAKEKQEEKPSPVTIKGMTKTIPSDLKKIAIDAYNTLYDEKILNTSNFSDYLGVVYLDTYESPMTDLTTELIVCLPFLIIGAIVIFVYFRKNMVTKKCIEKLEGKWEEVLQEMDATDNFYFKKARVYITRNYVVSYAGGLEVYPYSDIVWIYPHEYRYNGALSQKSIMMVTKNGKAHKLATVSASKKNLNTFDEMYDTLMNRMPNALSGYTKENKEKAKELYQK